MACYFYNTLVAKAYMTNKKQTKLYKRIMSMIPYEIIICKDFDPHFTSFKLYYN